MTASRVATPDGVRTAQIVLMDEARNREPWAPVAKDDLVTIHAFGESGTWRVTDRRDYGTETTLDLEPE